MSASVYQLNDTVGVILNERFSLLMDPSLRFNNFQVDEGRFNNTEMGKNNWFQYVYARTGGIYYNYNPYPNTWFTGFDNNSAKDTIVNGRTYAVNHVSRQVHFTNIFQGTAGGEVNSLLKINGDSVYYSVYLMDYLGKKTGSSASGKSKVRYKPL